MKKLVLSFAPPSTWRMNRKQEMSKDEWRKLRLVILERDDFSCSYCGFKAQKWQIVHHIDGDPNNNDHSNLETICPMCNYIHHSGLASEIFEVLDLYRHSDYSQVEIIQITRKMRAEGKTDDEIIKFLGLKEQVPFMMSQQYLDKLFGFVSSRPEKPKD